MIGESSANIHVYPNYSTLDSCIFLKSNSKTVVGVNPFKVTNWSGQRLPLLLICCNKAFPFWPDYP